MEENTISARTEISITDEGMTVTLYSESDDSIGVVADEWSMNIYEIQDEKKTVILEEDGLPVWNEIRLTNQGVGVSLYSAGEGSQPVVEDEWWMTMSEIRYAVDGSETQRFSLSL